MNYLINGLAFVVAIGLLVAVHEFGHFSVGRALGFKVLRFSIGFGRPLWSRTGRDGTEYVLAGIPLGGYVKFADEREAPVDAAIAGQAFNRRPIWARIAVLSAGPAANFLFAIAAFWLLFLYGIPGLRPIVGDVTLGSIGAGAGLHRGDEIVSVGGRPVATQESVVLALLDDVSGGGRVTLGVRGQAGERDIVLSVPEAQRRGLTEPGAWSSGLGFGFLQPRLPVVVGEVLHGGGAEAAGLKTGDRITAVDGVPVDDFATFVDLIHRRPDTTARLAVLRGTTSLTLPVAVRAETNPAKPEGPKIGRIGIGPGGEAQWPPGMLTEQRYGPIAAIPAAVGATWDKTAFTVKLLSRMVTGHVSAKNVSGPLSIATYAGLTARAGGLAFVSFLALISISLGVLNLVPIPILDGGQIVYQCAEAIRGRPLSERVQALGQQLGVAMLIVLMALAFYNDIARQLG